MRCGCETDLVVHNDMHGAAGLMADKAGQTETFRNNTLTGKGRITVQKDRHNLCAVVVVDLILLRADLADDNRVYSFKVGGVRCQGQVDGIAVKVTVG